MLDGSLKSSTPRIITQCGLIFTLFATVSMAESPQNHAASIDRSIVKHMLAEDVEDDYAAFRPMSASSASALPDTIPLGDDIAVEVPWIYRPRFLKTDAQRAQESLMKLLPASSGERMRSKVGRAASYPRRDPGLNRTQFDAYEELDYARSPAFDDVYMPETGPDSTPFSSIVLDPPIAYSGPDPSSDRDEDLRDGPRVPEPMVFDLVRGLGARKGELEVNILNLVPFQRGKSKYEWAPEIEFVPFDGFGVEYEMPIFNTEIVAHKFALQYTFGTALDDAFIHGVQHISYYDVQEPQYIPVLLYLTGLRLDETWSLFGMYGFSLGPQVFPFVDENTPYGLNLIINFSLFANVTEHLVLGLETNFERQMSGPVQSLIMPQLHYEFSDRFKVQFGYGLRDEVTSRFGELGFRVILER